MLSVKLDERFYRWIQTYVFLDSAIPGSNEVLELFLRRPNSMEVEQIPHGSRLVLSRSPQMDFRMAQLIDSIKRDERCCGLIYLMFWIDEDFTNRTSLSERLIPLYIGIAERMDKNRKGISENLRNPSFFGRWGYPNYYHIGVLSRALQTGIGRHSNWAAKLFLAKQSPTLVRPVYWWGKVWRSETDYDPMERHCHLTELEARLVGLAKQHPDNLNKNIPMGKACRCIQYKETV